MFGKNLQKDTNFSEKDNKKTCKNYKFKSNFFEFSR